MFHRIIWLKTSKICPFSAIWLKSGLNVHANATICSCFGTTIYIWWSWKFKFYVPEIICLLLLSISDQHNLVIYKFQSAHQKNIKLILLYSFDEHMQESWTMWMCLFTIQFLSLDCACNLHVLNLCTNTI